MQVAATTTTATSTKTRSIRRIRCHDGKLAMLLSLSLSLVTVFHCMSAKWPATGLKLSSTHTHHILLDLSDSASQIYRSITATHQLRMVFRYMKEVSAICKKTTTFQCHSSRSIRSDKYIGAHTHTKILLLGEEFDMQKSRFMAERNAAVSRQFNLLVFGGTVEKPISDQLIEDHVMVFADLSITICCVTYDDILLQPLLYKLVTNGSTYKKNYCLKLSNRCTVNL